MTHEKIYDNSFYLDFDDYHDDTYILKTISVNPKNPSPYEYKLVHIEKDLPEFGSLGKYIPEPGKKGSFSWETKDLYSMHLFDVVVVLAITENGIIVYGSKVGEREIPFTQNSPYNHDNTYNDYARVITPYYAKPKDGHRLLVQKNLEKNYYEIIHNITLARRKYEIDCHVI